MVVKFLAYIKQKGEDMLPLYTAIMQRWKNSGGPAYRTAAAIVSYHTKEDSDPYDASILLYREEFGEEALQANAVTTENEKEACIDTKSSPDNKQEENSTVEENTVIKTKNAQTTADKGSSKPAVDTPNGLVSPAFNQPLIGHKEQASSASFDKKKKFIAADNNQTTADEISSKSALDTQSESVSTALNQPFIGHKKKASSSSFDKKDKFIATGNNQATADEVLSKSAIDTQSGSVSTALNQPVIGHKEQASSSSFNKKEKFIATDNNQATADEVLSKSAVDTQSGSVSTALNQPVIGHKEQASSSSFDKKEQFIAMDKSRTTADEVSSKSAVDTQIESVSTALNQPLIGHKEQASSSSFDKKDNFIATDNNQTTADEVSSKFVVNNQIESVSTDLNQPHVGHKEQASSSSVENDETVNATNRVTTFTDTVDVTSVQKYESLTNSVMNLEENENRTEKYSKKTEDVTTVHDMTHNYQNKKNSSTELSQALNNNKNTVKHSQFDIDHKEMTVANTDKNTSPSPKEVDDSLHIILNDTEGMVKSAYRDEQTEEALTPRSENSGEATDSQAEMSDAWTSDGEE
ncbi:hypothetical protein CYMTET_3546 [Cymbomonas tetramitiformis]|uniref:Uncharacterized protein n=1 Tax=Cymbomonas tetramitiformis TaxID=36881 RepID=A0AAE0H2X2_9CHLO|nr:hypothetical protein CYMTET_3546 [Cymbomonas tetramitiformis]